MKNVKLKLKRNKPFPWYNKGEVYAKGYIFDSAGVLYKGKDLCEYFANVLNTDDFQNRLTVVNGIFSVIIQKDSLWVAVDRIRSFPLFYKQSGNNLYISDEINELYDGEEEKKLNKEACSIYTATSFVLGNKTLLEGIYQVQAGEFITFSELNKKSFFYHKFISDSVRKITFEEAKAELKDIISNVIERFSRLIGNREVILSLSGGLDSRLIAYMLKKAGKENVLCYTFGKKAGNPEWEYSKTVAEKLGFEWLFIDYETINEVDFYTQKDFINFYNYESQYVAKFGFMQYFAADYLINKAGINKNSLLLQGHGGDFFSGSHLRSYMQNYTSLKTIAKDLQYIHCNIVKLSFNERKKITSVIKNQLEFNNQLFSNIENWDLKERQAKYIINTNKLWEFHGHEVCMPLCDNELMDFFVSLPFEYRINQKLYKTVLYDLFKEYDINFNINKNTNVSQTIFIENLKQRVKRSFPFLRKKINVFQYDYFDYERFVQPILEELKSNKREIISMNGFFSEWYLLQVKKEIDS